LNVRRRVAIGREELMVDTFYVGAKRPEARPFRDEVATVSAEPE
jgi:hypothetical protein